MENNFDTIVAIITPIAQGAVGIVRISGEKSFDIARQIFSKEIKPKAINYGHIVDNGNIIDEVILLPFVAPHSYTGEDVIEIQCHGSNVILNEILELVISKGARLAQNGEYTKRAFLNGRIDLSQAEAVLDVIQSKSTKSAKNSLNNLDGYLKNKINEIKGNLSQLYSKVIASVDFPEDVAEINNNEVVTICNDNIKLIDEILSNANSHNFIRDGFSVALIGKPNVGKSSLFNALLNYNRAIVTDIAGTTRDTINETLNIDGYLINFIDTAGIRDKNEADAVEQIGIENSLLAIEKSNIILFLFEDSINEIDCDLLNYSKNKKYLFVKTKCDIKPYDTNDNDKIIQISSIQNKGIDVLKGEIVNIIRTLIPQDTDYMTNKRQVVCLKRAKEALLNVLNSVETVQFADLYAQDLKDSILALGEITGEILTDNILENIFDNFCIGK